MAVAAELEVADAVASFIAEQVAKLPTDSPLRSFGLQDARCWARVAGRRRLLLAPLPGEREESLRVVRDDEHPLSDRDFLAERREALRALERVVEHDDLPDHVRSAFKAQRSLLELYAPDVPGFKDGELDPFEGARLIERTLRETAARLPAEPRDRELRGLMLRSAGRWELIADTAPVNLTGGGA